MLGILTANEMDGSTVNLLLQIATYISSWGECVVSYEDKQAVPVPCL